MPETGKTTSPGNRQAAVDYRTSAPWTRLGYVLKMGLRTRAEADWLPLEDLFGDNGLRDRQISLKQTLSTGCHADIFAALPTSRDSGGEVLQMVQDHILAYHACPPPQASPDLHPLDAAARLIPEDLLLLEPRTENGQTRWHLVAGALAFPAHWVLAEKMGLPLAAIHEPVPHYAERLEAPMDKFFNAMQVGPISSRMNWSLQAGEEYFAPHRNDRIGVDEKNVATDLFLRIENQTLRKLPVTGQILFTIRTHMVPFGYWQDHPDAIGELCDMLAEMSPAARAYKGVHLYETAIKRWHAAIGQRVQSD